jgi:hypothetical protein
MISNAPFQRLNSYEEYKKTIIGACLKYPPDYIMLWVSNPADCKIQRYKAALSGKEINMTALLSLERIPPGKPDDPAG